jgi:hypothetical protein
LKQYADNSKRTHALRPKTVKCEAFRSLQANIARRPDAQAKSGHA